MSRTLLLSSLLLTATLAHAATNESTQLTGCAAKRQAISAQIEAAKSHGNSSQQAGLEKALKEVESHCDDASSLAERETKMVKAEEEVREREGDLREALADGDQDDIRKRQRKLEEARAELQQAREALSQ